MIVNQIPGQELEFELFDKDIDKDDFLGRYVSTPENCVLCKVAVVLEQRGCLFIRTLTL